MSRCELQRPAPIVSLIVFLIYALILPAHLHGQAQTGTQAQTPDSSQSDSSQGANSQPHKKPSGPACVSTEAAARQPNKDVCITAHVYDVVELANGTRFLDLCPADLPDDACRFTIISLAEDRDDVGELNHYRGRDVKVRGIVRTTHGRLGIVLTHVRQFNGGPEKFRPNPKLLHGFSGQSDREPIHDPNLTSSGRHRGFMDTTDREATHKSK